MPLYVVHRFTEGMVTRLIYLVFTINMARSSNLLQPFNPQYQNTNSPFLSSYISYRSGEKLLK